MRNHLILAFGLAAAPAIACMAAGQSSMAPRPERASPMESNVRSATVLTARDSTAPAQVGASSARAPAAASPDAGSPASWRIRGNLSEACTCSVPCTCNFGQAASPHHYCYAIFSLDIRKGTYAGVKLGGLHLACGNADKGSVWYVDERASAAQFEALRAIASEISRKLVGYWRSVDPKIVEDPQFKLLAFKSARIVQSADAKGSRLEIGGIGRFESDVLLGMDGKTPIVLENNWSWNIRHGIKGKTRRLKYEDEYGNAIDETDTNANEGQFDWSDKTPIYLR